MHMAAISAIPLAVSRFHHGFGLSLLLTNVFPFLGMDCCLWPTVVGRDCHGPLGAVNGKAPHGMVWG